MMGQQEQVLPKVGQREQVLPKMMEGTVVTQDDGRNSCYPRWVNGNRYYPSWVNRNIVVGLVVEFIRETRLLLLLLFLENDSTKLRSNLCGLILRMKIMTAKSYGGIVIFSVIVATAYCNHLCDMFKTHVRRFATFSSKVLSNYMVPWERPNRDKLVTHIDATPDSYSKLGGVIAYVTRDKHARITASGTKWIPGLQDATRLEFRGLIEYTSMKPKGSVLTICTDNNVIVRCLEAVSSGQDNYSDEMKGMARQVLENLKANFDEEVEVKWVPNKCNGLADALSRFEMCRYVAEVSCCDTFDES